MVNGVELIPIRHDYNTVVKEAKEKDRFHERAHMVCSNV